MKRTKNAPHQRQRTLLRINVRRARTPPKMQPDALADSECLSEISAGRLLHTALFQLDQASHILFWIWFEMFSCLSKTSPKDLTSIIFVGTFYKIQRSLQKLKFFATMHQSKDDIWIRAQRALLVDKMKESASHQSINKPWSSRGNFPGTCSHPKPGNQLRLDHWLWTVLKHNCNAQQTVTSFCRANS